MGERRRKHVPAARRPNVSTSLDSPLRLLTLGVHALTGAFDGALAGGCHPSPAGSCRRNRSRYSRGLSTKNENHASDSAPPRSARGAAACLDASRSATPDAAVEHDRASHRRSRRLVADPRRRAPGRWCSFASTCGSQRTSRGRCRRQFESRDPAGPVDLHARPEEPHVKGEAVQVHRGSRSPTKRLVSFHVSEVRHGMQNALFCSRVARRARGPLGMQQRSFQRAPSRYCAACSLHRAGADSPGTARSRC